MRKRRFETTPERWGLFGASGVVPAMNESFSLDFLWNRHLPAASRRAVAHSKTRGLVSLRVRPRLRSPPLS